MTTVDRLLLCTCSGSMSVDEGALSAATGVQSTSVSHALCTTDLDTAVAAFRKDGACMVACGQQKGFFESVFEEVKAPGELVLVDIRDRAGWTADNNAHAKQAALLAEATLPHPKTPVRDVESAGTILIAGIGQPALYAARRLADKLAVTCLLAGVPDHTEPDPTFDLVLGSLKQVTGSVGSFELVVEKYQELDPSGRGPVSFEPAAKRAVSKCDIILDLRGEAPLFPAAHKRDGYVRADPGDPIAVERAILDALLLQGIFEKPLYIRFDAERCVHSRAQQRGCERCLTVCPTGAILPSGDHVEIDAAICAGCGACATVCPSGCTSYDDPPVGFLFARLRALLSTYRTAGGSDPRVLFLDAEHGAEMVRLSARYGRGLPADVIPVEVANIEGIGHAEILAAFGVGGVEVLLLAGPRTVLDVSEHEIEIVVRILAAAGHRTERVRIVNPADPDALEDILYGNALAPFEASSVLPAGNRREVTRLVASALAGTVAGEGAIALPAGAPYGAIEIDTEACTLCLACVSLCPVGALGDNPEKPQVTFREAACLQCGICGNACPEDAITLKPQLALDNAALAPQVLNEEEPFKCIQCGKPFGVKSTIEKIIFKLQYKHWMFQGSDNAKLIQMCDDCRVKAQYHQEDSPFRIGDRPAVRTTDDYLDPDKKPN